MRLFIVRETGSYALRVEVHRAENQQTLQERLSPLDDSIFDTREIIEITVEGEPGKLFGTCFIE